MDKTKITVCIGSSCHIKGSRQVIEELQKMISENNLSEKYELCGAFCMKNCVNGVSVKIGDNIYSVKPETVSDFFTKEILSR